jgi:Fic family protein
VDTAPSILKIFKEDQEKIKVVGKPSASMLIVQYHMQRYPMTDSKKIVSQCNITLPTAIKSLNHLVDLGIVKEITGKARNKIFSYQKYLALLNEG